MVSFSLSWHSGTLTTWVTVLVYSDLFCYLLIFYKSTRWPDKPNILLLQCDSTEDLFFLSQKKKKEKKKAKQNQTVSDLSVVRLYCAERREQYLVPRCRRPWLLSWHCHLLVNPSLDLSGPQKIMESCLACVLRCFSYSNEIMMKELW